MSKFPLSSVAVLMCSATLAQAEVSGHFATSMIFGGPDFTADGTYATGSLRYFTDHEVEADLGPLEFHLDGQVTLSANSGAAINATQSLRQAYVEFGGETFVVGLGRHVSVRGVADGFNPIDVVSPRNYRLSAYETQANRFGVDGIWGSLFLGTDVTIEAQVLAGKKSNLLPDGTYNSGFALPDRPVESDDLAIDARLGWSAEFGDLSVSAYSGPANQPFLAPDGAGTAAVLPGLTMVGAEFDAVIDVWRLYGEVAYHAYDAGAFDVADGFLPDDEILAVLGAERELDGANRLGVQVFFRHLQEARDPATGPAALLATTARQIYGQFDDRQIGASLSFVWESEDTRTSAEVAVSSWFQGDRYLRLRGKHRLGPDQALYLHADLLDGPAASPYGALKDSSTVGLEFRQSF